MTTMPPLTLRQGLLIVDAVNGLGAAERTAKARLLEREVAAVIALGSPEIWAAEGRALLDMIAAWTTGRRLVVVDAAERFWTCTEGGYEEGLREVGLLSEGASAPVLSRRRRFRTTRRRCDSRRSDHAPPR
ncbi:hypothetical protein [Nonomuraea rhodomycinica]|uniref:Uncharacterized protein n=1 Tax=Nonomuraea rhodomycinica TaxID=1712872 RepID=A0A7Y6MAJ4_9ACTN|nr:hypothetical protein [Nonomuraea rhodomycinica]NUW39544.1 hypothetical protein [Nonomuraea rhodomycinica]